MKQLSIIVMLFACSLFGCAQTTANLEKAVQVFKAGHEKIQAIADATQEFCQVSRARLELQNIDVTEFKKDCDKIWNMFKEYKKATDVLLELEE